MVGSPRPGGNGGSGDREHLAPLFGRQPRGDQGAGPDLGLDDDHAARQARDDTVTPRKVAGLGPGPRRAFRQDTALGHDPVVQILIIRRIDVIYAPAQHGHRARRQGPPVRGGIDPPGEARDDGWKP